MQVSTVEDLMNHATTVKQVEDGRVDLLAKAKILEAFAADQYSKQKDLAQIAYYTSVAHIASAVLIATANNRNHAWVRPLAVGERESDCSNELRAGSSVARSIMEKLESLGLSAFIEVNRDGFHTDWTLWIGLGLSTDVNREKVWTFLKEAAPVIELVLHNQ